jgi:hypothetical protein
MVKIRIKHRVVAQNLSTDRVRTVPYRFPLQLLSRTRSLG